MNLLMKTYEEFTEDRAMQMAAALAFYTMLSLAPLLFLVLTVAGMIVGPDAIDTFNQQAQNMVGQSGSQEIQQLLRDAHHPGGNLLANVVSIVVLVFSATGLVAQLQASLNQAWDVKVDPEQSGLKTFLLKRVISLGMILGIALLLLVAMLVTTALGTVGGTVSKWLDIGAVTPYLVSQSSTLVVAILAFAAVFKLLPDARIRWQDVWIGAALTAVLFTVGQFLIGLYFGHSKMSTTYGQAGSLVLLLVWIYYSSMIFFFGAEFTQVWARRHGREIEPAKGAVRAGKRTESPESPTARASFGASGEPATREPQSDRRWQHPAPSRIEGETAAGMVTIGIGLGAVCGIAAVVLSIIGLAGTSPTDMAAGSAIVAGAGLMLIALAGAGRCVAGVPSSDRAAIGPLELGGGAVVSLLCGAGGVALGILVVMGAGPGGIPAMPAAVAATVLGSGFVLSSGASTRAVRSLGFGDRKEDKAVQRSGLLVFAADGIQVLAGLAAVVLGILVADGASPALSLVALLSMGGALTLGGLAAAGQALLNP